jgi:hemoglobin/transferrin/lactoferrin receptor protein
MGKHGPDEYVRPDYVFHQNGTDIVLINDEPEVQQPTRYNQINIMQKVRFKPNASWDLTYGLHFSETSDYSRYDRLILREGDDLANAEWYYGPQKWMMHTLRVDQLASTSLSDHVRVVAGYQNYEESRHNRSFGNTRRTNRFEAVKAFSLNTDADKKLSERVTLFYGSELILNRVGSKAYREDITDGERSGVTTRYPDGSTWRSLAAYLSAKVRLSDRWLLNASGRFNHVTTHATFDTTFFDFPFTEASLRNSALNGAIGIIFNRSLNWKFYSNLSTGFRAPNVDDIGKVFDSEPGNVIVPNPDLNPERAFNIEIGTTGKLSEKISIDVALYYTILSNAIARGVSSFNGQDSILYDGELSRVLSLQNISQVYVYGFQLGIDYSLNEIIRFTSTFNWQNGKEKDPETNRDFRPTHAAPPFGSTHIIYDRKKVKADLYAQYNGIIPYSELPLSERADSHLYAKNRNGDPYAPSWFTLNLKTSYQIIKNITIDAGVENIFDKRYRPYSSGISAPGRNFIFSVRASW